MTTVQHKKDADPVASLSPDDAAWLDEPSATPDISWIEDDLQKTPVDELMASNPVQGRVPFNPELALTPPPATPGSPRRPSKTPIRRPVIERVRPREELREAARASVTREKTAKPVVVQVEAAHPKAMLLYAGAVAAGIASGLAVLFLGK